MGGIKRTFFHTMMEKKKKKVQKTVELWCSCCCVSKTLSKKKNAPVFNFFNLIYFIWFFHTKKTSTKGKRLFLCKGVSGKVLGKRTRERHNTK